MRSYNNDFFGYQAPDPYQQNASWLKWFENKITFSNKLLGTIVLPAQAMSEQTDYDALQQFAKKNQIIINSGLIKTHDHALIDTVEIIPEYNRTGDPFDQYFIVKFLGNGMQYTDCMNTFTKDAKKLKANVIGFDYRGVGSSKNSPVKFQDLITDGIAQVNRLLLDIGADPQKILLDGLSLGGAVATMVAKYFHDQGSRVYLWNDRSFASISKTIAGIYKSKISRFFQSPLNTLSGDLLFCGLENSSWTITKTLGWEADVAQAYLDIPDKYKNYMVVVRKSAKSEGDGVIHHQASLHHAVKETERMKTKTGNKVYAFDSFGHNLPRSELISKAELGKNGQELFEEFVLSTRIKI